MTSIFTLRRVALAAVIFSLGMSRGALAQSVQSILSNRPNASINAIIFDPTGALYVGGNFTSIGDQSRGRVTKLLLNQDGTYTVAPLATFADPKFDGNVAALALDGNELLVGGLFKNVGTVAQSNLAKLNADGTLKTTYAPSAGSDVYAIATLPSGITWVATGSGVKRFDPSGAPFQTSNIASVEGKVYALLVQPDGKVVIGGEFSKVGGQTRRNVARLNLDGSLDTAFKADTDATADTDGNGSGVASRVVAIGRQPDGKILIGGYFVSINGKSQKYLARVNGTTGALDTTFKAVVNGGVTAFAIDHAGDVVIGGEFTQVSGLTRGRIAKLNAAGTVYPNAFTAVANGGLVYSLGQEQNGRVLVGGNFTSLGGVANTAGLAAVFNASTAGVEITAMVDPVADEIFLRFAGFGSLPIIDYLSFFHDIQAVVATETSPVVPASIAFLADSETPQVSRFIEEQVPIWTAKLNGRSEEANASFPLLVLGSQTQNAGGASRYAWGTHEASAENLVARPTVEFAAATSTASETDTTVKQIGIKVTGTVPYRMRLPITLTGTATSGTDYTTTVTSLLIPSGTANTTINVDLLTLKDDRIVDQSGSNETVIVNFGALGSNTGFVTLGTVNTHTLTITESDLPPSITGSPAGGFFYPGNSHTMEVLFTANGTSKVQWFKNNVAIPSATGNTLTLSKMKTSAAGSYKVRVTNDAKLPSGAAAFAEATVANIAVVTPSSAFHTIRADLPDQQSNLTLTAVVASPTAATYKWKRNGVDLVSGSGFDFTNTGLPVLSITKIQPAASGNFECLVTYSNVTLSAGTHVLAVVSGPPDFTNEGLTPGRVATPYDDNLPIKTTVELTPETVFVSGLPAGLTFNSFTRRITGTPTKAGDFNLKVSATNTGGTTQFTIPLTIQSPAGGIVGTFVALLPRLGDATDIGGMVQLTTSVNGGLTGTLHLQGTKRAFKGSYVSAAPSGGVISNNDPFSGSATLATFAGDPAPRLEFNFNSPGLDQLTVTLSHDTLGRSGEGWRNKWSTAVPVPTTIIGRHNFGANQADTSAPVGGVSGAYVVSTNGAVTILGNLPDNTSLASTSLLGPSGQVLLFKPLSNNKGSVITDINDATFVRAADPSVVGTFQWFKAETPGTALYPDAFGPVNITLTGNHYTPPAANTPVMGLSTSAATNLTIDVSGSDLVSSFSAGAKVSTANKVSITVPLANTNKVKLSFSAATGQFTGSFTEPSTSSGPTRTTTFRGTTWLSNSVGAGFGNFLLPKLTDTVSNSKKLSGLISLTDPAP